MFSVAVTWPVIENIVEYMDANDFPVPVLMNMVHYSEHLQFHRAIRPEDVITLRGKVAAILPHRAGTHMVIRFDAINQLNDLVFTEFMGGLIRGVSCEDGGGGEAEVSLLCRRTRRMPCPYGRGGFPSMP